MKQRNISFFLSLICILLSTRFLNGQIIDTTHVTSHVKMHATNPNGATDIIIDGSGTHQTFTKNPNYNAARADTNNGKQNGTLATPQNSQKSAPMNTDTIKVKNKPAEVPANQPGQKPK